MCGMPLPPAQQPHPASPPYPQAQQPPPMYPPYPPYPPNPPNPPNPQPPTPIPPGGATPYGGPFPPPPPGPYYPYPRPPKGDSGRTILKVIVVAVVVIIVVCVALAAVFFYLVTNTDWSEKPQVAVYFGSPSLELHNRSGTQVWDGTFTVTKVTPSDSVLPWTNLRTEIKAGSGVVLVPRSPMAADTGNYSTSVPIPVQVWYEEAVGGAEVLNPGDAIKFTGLGLEYEGAVLWLYNGTTLVGSETLTLSIP